MRMATPGGKEQSDDDDFDLDRFLAASQFAHQDLSPDERAAYEEGAVYAKRLRDDLHQITGEDLTNEQIDEIDRIVKKEIPGFEEAEQHWQRNYERYDQGRSG